MSTNARFHEISPEEPQSYLFFDYRRLRQDSCSNYRIEFRFVQIRDNHHRSRTLLTVIQ